MAKYQVFDTKTNKPAGVPEIPDDVLSAAALVYEWMQAHRKSTASIELHGLRLADDD